MDVDVVWILDDVEEPTIPVDRTVELAVVISVAVVEDVSFRETEADKVAAPLVFCSAVDEGTRPADVESWLNVTDESPEEPVDTLATDEEETRDQPLETGVVILTSEFADVEADRGPILDARFDFVEIPRETLDVTVEEDFIHDMEELE